MPEPAGPPTPQQPPTLSGVLRRAGPATPLALLWAIAPAILGIQLLASMGTVGDYLHSHSAGLAIYIGVFMLGAGLGILPTYAQSILGGWVFGFAIGFPAALLGFLGGAIIGYAAARTVARTRVEQLIAENAKARAVHAALVGRGFWSTMGVVALLRLPPNSPFALTNLVMAAVGVPKVAFAAGTLLGMAPRTGVAVAFAAVAARGGRDIQEFLEEGPGKWVLIGGIVVMFAVLALLGHIGKKAVERVVSSRGESGIKSP